MIPQKYRHRAAAIESVLRTATLDKQETKALQNGYAFGDTKQLVDAKMDELYKSDGGNNADVPFEVVCSYSNWFDAHPEKIAGTPEISSSSTSYSPTSKGILADSSSRIALVLVIAHLPCFLSASIITHPGTKSKRNPCPNE